MIVKKYSKNQKVFYSDFGVLRRNFAGSEGCNAK